VKFNGDSQKEESVFANLQHEYEDDQGPQHPAGDRRRDKVQQREREEDAQGAAACGWCFFVSHRDYHYAVSDIIIII
jgi:hypothetical protein